MQNEFRDQTILDVIRILASRGESGRLQITSGMTDGDVFIDKGELIDARFAKLTGFQAINALASLRDVTFSFDPSITPPGESSITPKERILLQDFFGIGGVHHDMPYPPFEGRNEDEPAQVVPLSEVDEPENFETHETFVTPSATGDSSLPPPLFTEAAATTPAAPDYYADEAVVPNNDEATMVRRRKPLPENRQPITYGSASRSRFRPALFVTLLILLAAAAGALVYRFRERSSTTPATVQTSTPASDQQVSNSTEAPADGQQATNSANTTSAVPNLSGNWNVVNTIEQTSYQPYKNMKVGFELAINQSGNEFTGQGQKVSENGQSLSGESRTPIVVQGSIDGDKVEATFSENGALRKTSGRFVWRIDRANGALNGTFATNAARSSGRSAATKRF